MTYVEWEVPNGSLVSRYIVSPVNITYPHVLSSAPGTVMRLVGITVISDGGGEFLNTTSVVISPSGRPQVIVVKPNYSAYYLVSVRSLGWVTINGTRTNNYTNWLINGSVLIIRAEPNYLGNGTRLVPINGSEVSIIIERPMNLTIDWVRQYLVSIASNYPVMVNGSLTTNYVGWINECDYLVVNASIYYESGGVRYVPINGTGAFRICTPMNITVGWETQYLITVVSPIPIEVNGAMASDYVGWFANGSRISILVPKYYYPGNGTRFVLWSPVNGTVTVRGPMLIKITYSPQYLVIITSPLPIIINGTRAMNYTAWAYPSTIIKLSIPKYQVLPNLTLMIATSIYVNNHEYPLRGSVLLIINSPTSVVVEYGRSYMTYLALALITLLALVIIMKFRGSANDHHGDEAVTL
ncbi:hypothetical protein [Vulcanisaeta sp. JCM 16161]|uniref:hypothetical protein n=1 Tax=Vulcanisaeta sp. JCM 16161 TaxID=1295372 RepID=UPI000ABAE4B9|nr:hypothetical protein [Vulcanisaeta sp. JCM 16161]